MRLFYFHQNDIRLKRMISLFKMILISMKYSLYLKRENNYC